MKKFLFAFMAATLLPSLFLPIASAKTVDKDIVVVISETANSREQYAAETLRRCVEEVSGKEVRIIRDCDQTDAYRIIVGKTTLSQCDTTGLADGSYYIKSIDNGIEIAGAGNRGDIYGVYRFLDEFAGFKCYSQKIGLKSYTGKLDIPENVDIKYTPYFEYTETDWLSPTNDIYSLANGLSGGAYRYLSPEQGGRVCYISKFCHTLTDQFCSKEKYFEEHPEYFSLENGERTTSQLCLTNEDVYNIVLSEVMELLNERHDPSADLQIISITQADSYEDVFGCECEKCRAIDDANGSPSGTMIAFVNRIARAVKEAGYDNVAIDTFAYRYTRKAPTQIKPEPNVIVRLCSIECCFSHALDDATCDRNVMFMQDLEDWNKICDHIYIWDYTTNYRYTVGIFPDFGVIQKNIQIFAENGVKGVYEEGNYYVRDCDTEFGELRAYLLSRLMQNPYCDLEKEATGFCRAFYGKGGDKIYKAIKLLTENSQKQHFGIYDKMSTCFTLENKDARAIDKLWRKAKLEAAGDKFALANIKRSEISWRYVKSSLNLREFRTLLGRARANRKLYKDIVDHGVKTFCEAGYERGLYVVPIYEYLPAEIWSEGIDDESKIKLYTTLHSIWEFFEKLNFFTGKSL